MVREVCSSNNEGMSFISHYGELINATVNQLWNLTEINVNINKTASANFPRSLKARQRALVVLLIRHSLISTNVDDLSCRFYLDLLWFPFPLSHDLTLFIHLLIRIIQLQQTHFFLSNQHFSLYSILYSIQYTVYSIQYTVDVYLNTRVPKLQSFQCTLKESAPGIASGICSDPSESLFFINIGAARKKNEVADNMKSTYILPTTTVHILESSFISTSH
jgi:hypothetical protein